MGSETKEARMKQKDHWQIQLDKRLTDLSQRGVSPEDTAKDAAVRKIRAQIRKANGRLRAIDAKEKKSAEMAEAKKKKAAASKSGKKKDKKGQEKAPEMSKRQQKKKAKKAEKAAKKAKE